MVSIKVGVDARIEISVRMNLGFIRMEFGDDVRIENDWRLSSDWLDTHFGIVRNEFLSENFAREYINFFTQEVRVRRGRFDCTSEID